MKNTLANVHNQMMTISTKGEDSIKMSQCLLVLRQVIVEMEEQEQAAKEQPEENGPKDAPTSDPLPVAKAVPAVNK